MSQPRPLLSNRDNSGWGCTEPAAFQLSRSHASPDCTPSLKCHLSPAPQYDGTGALERPEPVPFRLTRNLANFFTPFGVEGIFVTSLIAGAQVDHHLCWHLQVSSLCIAGVWVPVQ